MVVIFSTFLFIVFESIFGRSETGRERERESEREREREIYFFFFLVFFREL